MRLTGLKSNTTYHARVRSTDIASNKAESADFTFRTGKSSLGLDGATGFAEVAHTTDLNLSGDWTVEAWFKDEDPNGFNHDFVTLLSKGDREADAEAPYFVTLGFKQFLVGQRADWVDYAVNYNLWSAGLDPAQWHHLAVSFQAATRTLLVYVDGSKVAEGVLEARSQGNTAPVNLGRNGPQAGKYFQGKLGDVRIWSTVRSAADIANKYKAQLGGPQPGLVANWRFDEGSGTTAADSSGNHHDATLNGGASFSTDVHP